jgi:hypothetical protein
MRADHGGALVASSLVALLVGCASHDPTHELQVSDLTTYWIVDSPQQGQNYIAPVVRFRLRNVSPQPLTAIQARARFPAPNQEDVWGSIQEQVSTWRHPLAPGADTLVTVRSAGRYHSAADPQDILRSPKFEDPAVEVFVRIGASNWVRLAQGRVERRIGAPELGAPVPQAPGSP